MIPPEMLMWFGFALLAAGTVLLIGWKLTEPEPVVFVAPEYEPFRRVSRETYSGRHRKGEDDPFPAYE